VFPRTGAQSAIALSLRTAAGRFLTSRLVEWPRLAVGSFQHFSWTAQ